MEIDKMITISAEHICDQTLLMLNRSAYNTTNWMDESLEDAVDLCVYMKGEFGWFIHIPDDVDDRDLPKDLLKCIQFALMNDCVWLCLDYDAAEIDELPTYCENE